MTATKKPRPKFSWREGPWLAWFDHKALDPNAAGRELLRLRKRYGAAIKRRDVLDDVEARGPESPLYPAFEWDDIRAARLYRERQAQGLIDSIQVEYTGISKEPERVFLHVNFNEHDGYETLENLRKDPELRDAMLAEARNFLDIILRRYGHISELADVIEAIERWHRETFH